jgi:hypothetical protein
MQHAHKLSQQRLSFRQRYFIVATGMPIRNQLNIRGNKHTSIATNYFWMQQPHELSQQRLHFRQRYFIVAIGMPTRNQLNIRGNKHTSIATNNFLDATGT